MAAKAEDQAERVAASVRSSEASPSAPAASSAVNASGRSVGKKRRLASAPPPAQASSKEGAVRGRRSSLDRTSSIGDRSKANGSRNSRPNRDNANGAASGTENGGIGSRPVDKRRFARRTRPPTPTAKPPVQQETKNIREVNEPSNSSGVSETTSFLFQMNCRMLQSQLLAYDLQMSQLDEKSALVLAERTRWENKIAKMQRKLRDLDERSELMTDSDPATAASANSNAPPRQSTSSTEHQQASSSGNNGNNNGVVTARDSVSGQTNTAMLTDTVTPSSVELVENEIQETMRQRRQRLSDIIKTLHGVDDLPNQQDAKLL